MAQIQENAEELRLPPLDLDAAFTGRARRVPFLLFYSLAMALVALVILMLPVLYLGLIAGLGYGVYEYAIHFFPRRIWMAGGSVWGTVCTVMLYLIPIFSGALAVLFTLKPLLARPPTRIPARMLKPEDEPEFFEFVRRLCKAMGAPMPRRIGMVCQVNASMDWPGGLFGILFRRMRLEVGLPLAAGMNLRQFTGILAHELAHCRQGFGLIFHYVIASINLWFHRVVYDQEIWSDYLRIFEGSKSIWVPPIMLLTIVYVWLTRRVLWVFMWVGFVLSAFLERQQEYLADLSAARVTGSDGLGESLLLTGMLDLAWQKSLSDLSHAYQEQRLGDDLPAMIVANMGVLTPGMKLGYLNYELGEKTRLFDDHPSLADRLRLLEKHPAAGVFLDERPAASLFRNFEELCRTVSLDYYASVLGSGLARSRLVPSRELIRRRQELDSTLERAQGFYGGCLDVDRPLLIEPRDLVEPENPKAVAKELLHARERVEALLPGAREGYQKLLQSWNIDLLAFVGERLNELRAGGGMAMKDEEKAAAIREKARLLSDEAEMIVLPFEDAMKRRLLAAIRLLYTEPVRQRLPESRQLLDRADRLIEAYYCYSMVRDNLAELRRSFRYLERMLSHLKSGETREAVWDAYRKMTRPIVRLMDQIRGSMALVRYPFSHADGAATMGQYIMDVPADSKDVLGTYHRAKEMLSRLDKFFYRAAGELAQIAGQVEEALNLPPLAMPPEGEKK